MDISLDPGMFVSLILLFLPRIFNMYRRVAEAGEMRGISISKRTFVVPFLCSAIDLDGPLAVVEDSQWQWELRGYSPYRSIRLSRFKKQDGILLGLSAIMFLL